MPNVLLEAMAAGAIPIASEAGAMEAVVGEGGAGFLFPPEDRRALADTLVRAAALTEEEQTAMSARARERVSRDFSMDRELEIYAELLAPRREPLRCT